MLLLSVVSINIMQNAGIIEKVKLAKEEHRASTIQEQKELFEKEIEISKYEGNTPKTINDLLNKLEEEKLITEEEKNTIKETGRVTIGSKEIVFSEDAILPDGYTRCEYLESTGTQYIDTGYIPDSKTRAEVDLEVSDWTTMRANFFGSGDTVNNARFNIGMDTSKTKFQWNIADKFLTSIANKTTNRIIIKMDAKNHKLIIDDTEYVQNTPNYSLIDNNTLSFWLFAGNGAFKSYMKVFACKIYDNDILIQDLIPCLDTNGKPCMYDTVSGKTFYNQGTGEFIAGPIVE